MHTDSYGLMSADGPGPAPGQMAGPAHEVQGRRPAWPVWFIIEGDSLVFNTHRHTAKGRALARDPRASLCVDEEEPPYAFVQVQGEAELSEDPAELVRTATAIAARYMGAERAGEFGQRNGVPGELVVRLRPVKVLVNFDVTG